MSSDFALEVHHVDPSCHARVATLRTPHGSVDLPAFMPVGTQGAVKGLTVEQIRGTGSQMILGNTYHLALRPGEEIVAELGGLHRFMGWDGPILTDSGGFQVFSLAQMTKITDRSVTFQSHIDGRTMELSPERAVEIQEALGSDIAMVLDHVVALPAPRDQVSEAVRRTIDWAARCRATHTRADQVLFAIVQGGLDLELRCQCADELVAMDFPGYAIGGLSVGESIDEMEQVLAATAPMLPEDRPRYLMGVGRPVDLLNAISHGVDMFDCVLPTRNGRNAMAFTDAGSLRLRNERFRRDPRTLEADCPCPACRHSRAYLRHLFMAREMLGPILLTLHNVTYYQRLMSRAREAIRRGELVAFREERLRQWNSGVDE